MKENDIAKQIVDADKRLGLLINFGAPLIKQVSEKYQLQYMPTIVAAQNEWAIFLFLFVDFQ